MKTLYELVKSYAAARIENRPAYSFEDCVESSTDGGVVAAWAALDAGRKVASSAEVLEVAERVDAEFPLALSGIDYDTTITRDVVCGLLVDLPERVLESAEFAAVREAFLGRQLRLAAALRDRKAG